MDEVTIFIGLNAVERAHLRELTILFLRRKHINGAHGLVITKEMAILLAAQACLPILKLGLQYYKDWSEVMIYPGAFRIRRKLTDVMGVVSNQDQILSGESWSRGPVILSWDDVANDQNPFRSGHNVVIHEFAHKLDMLNGNANGMPPLHSNMLREVWTTAFSDAFVKLQQQLAHHHPSLNPYGATAPAEFFAVASESFFSDPQTLHHQFPQVYEQLALFYLQDPIKRQLKQINDPK